LNENLQQNKYTLPIVEKDTSNGDYIAKYINKKYCNQNECVWYNFLGDALHLVHKDTKDKCI